LARLNEDIRGTTELGDVFLEQQAPSWHGCSVCGRVLRLSANSTQQIRKQSPRRPNMGRALDCDFILPPYLGHEIPRERRFFTCSPSPPPASYEWADVPAW
jgi:hypothetical protein